MKKTDMELQAIRDKLRLLESEPQASEVLSVPWSSPQQSSFGPSSLSSAAAKPIRTPHQAGHHQNHQHASHTSPQAMAIEALKQRSGSQVTQASRADELIAKEIYRLEVHAQNINERSQQQANEILALKRSAQQAAIALRRQGIHSHPQLETIEAFLAPYPSAAVPHLERDSQGNFALSHTTINLHRAEEEAQSTAETLRNRQSAHPLPYQPYFGDKNHEADLSHNAGPTLRSLSKPPFSQPISAGPSANDYVEEELTVPRDQNRYQRTGKRSRFNFGKWFTRSKQGTPGFKALSSGRFSLMDGAIWFSSAAIARIMLEAIVLSYPIMRMPLLIILFILISFAIYRVVVSKSSELTSAFRLGITLLGLFIGGSL